MNFLAHFLLSHHDPQLLAGNFVADWVKGNKWKDFPEGISRGILHHRFIDDFTDRHDVTRLLTLKLRPLQRKYAGVAVDILYDHLLATSFSEYTHHELEEFAAVTYDTLYRYQEYFPAPAKHTLDFMSSRDWLSGYATAEGIDWAFKGLSRRASAENNLALAPAQLAADQHFFSASFRRFFPSLVLASGTFLENQRNS